MINVLTCLFVKEEKENSYVTLNIKLCLLPQRKDQTSWQIQRIKVDKDIGQLF